ncbi:AsmA family protein [Vibrio ordalii]|uniref:AsmA family protein n=1 Tax=Vibrio ordalii TaxID=28174 RepID=UPI00024832E1|nr:AsmA family protein [Vibrio ordalii]
MNKALALLIAIIALFLTFMLGMFALLHTSYATPVAQTLVERLSKGNVRFQSLQYQYPLHFQFNQLTLRQNKQYIPIEQADIWLSPQLIRDQKIAVDSILLRGINLQNGLPTDLRSWPISVSQIALNHADIAQQGWVARGVNLQIKNPYWLDDSTGLPFGEIQLSVEQWYWQGEALNNLLLDMDYKPENSTVYGLSLSWRGSAISGQAEQYPQGWSLINVTLEKLNLSREMRHSLRQSGWFQIFDKINHINSLDVLNSQIELADISLRNVDISLENIYPHANIWQQQQGKLSLRADDATWLGQQWIEPIFSLRAEPEVLIVEDFSSEFKQGDIQWSGAITPTSASLQQLTIRGVKWVSENKDDFTSLSQHWPWVDNLIIEQLTIANSQLIQLVVPPYWQLSGVYAKGQHLTLVKEGHLGLWRGALNISANSASYDSLLSTQSVVEMRSEQGQWYLDRLFMPLESGYIDATARWDFQTLSQPWQANIHADGLPLTVLNKVTQLPFSIEGISELEAQFNGLAGDYATFAHSLAGEATLNIRQGVLTLSDPEQNLSHEPFTLEGLAIRSDRGRIVINTTPLVGKTLKANLDGHVDLVEFGQGEINLNLQQKCRKMHFELLHDTQRTAYSCDADTYSDHDAAANNAL